jgi:hypothetical protein
MKECKKCGTLAPLEGFYRNKDSKDGRQGKCKPCAKRLRKVFEKENPNYRKEEGAKYRAKKGCKTWEEWLAFRKEHAVGRKVILSRYNHKRRLRTNRPLSEIDSFVFDQSSELTRLREEATGRQWHIDHIVPLNHNKISGLHAAQNFQVVPASWNRKKSNTRMNEWDYQTL